MSSEILDCVQEELFSIVMMTLVYLTVKGNSNLSRIIRNITILFSTPNSGTRCNKCKHLNLSLKIIRVVIQNITTFWILNVDRNLPACSLKQRYKFFLLTRVWADPRRSWSRCTIRSLHRKNRKNEEAVFTKYPERISRVQNKKGKRKWKSREWLRRFVLFSCVFSSFRSQFFEGGAMKHETRHRPSPRDKIFRSGQMTFVSSSKTQWKVSLKEAEQWRVSYSRYRVSLFP